MEITCSENSNNCIFKLHSKVLTIDIISHLKKILKTTPKNKKIALNLQNVDYFCTEFLELLKEYSIKHKISIINLQAELLAVLNLTNYNDLAHIFLSERDFLEQKRALLNRKFSILSNF